MVFDKVNDSQILRRWVVKNKEKFKESNSGLYSRVPNIPGVPNKSVGGIFSWQLIKQEEIYFKQKVSNKDS